MFAVVRAADAEIPRGGGGAGEVSRKQFDTAYTTDYKAKGQESIYGPLSAYIQSFLGHLESHHGLRTCLEVACGDGRVLIEVAQRGLHCTGTDLCGESALKERARLHGVQVGFFAADATTCALQDGPYDVTICVEALHHMQPDQVFAILERMQQATSPGGLIFVSILADLERRYLANGETFRYEGQHDYSTAEVQALYRRMFEGWNFLEQASFPDRRSGPAKPADNQVAPYIWKGDFVYLIAQKPA